MTVGTKSTKKPVRAAASILAACCLLNLGMLPAYASTRDSDRDGMPNRWELNHNLNAQRANAGGDADHDALKNLAEYRHGTLPKDEDTDNDGMDDGDEVRDDRASTDVDDRDTNDDGELDGDENADHDALDNEDEDDAKESCVADDSDSDKDGIANEDENDFGTKVHDADSDDDGLEDGDEDSDEDGEADEDEDDSADDDCDDESEDLEDENK